MSERSAAPDGGVTLSESAEEKIEAWERKRAEETGSEQSDDLSDDAESGGP
jgi:hypothetical protein